VQVALVLGLLFLLDRIYGIGQITSLAVNEHVRGRLEDG